MSRIVRGTKYRKVKNRGSRWGNGRVHLVFYSKVDKQWKYVCPKRIQEWGITDDEVPDDTYVTCLGCKKYAGDVVEKMEKAALDLEDYR